MTSRLRGSFKNPRSVVAGGSRFGNDNVLYHSLLWVSGKQARKRFCGICPRWRLFAQVDLPPRNAPNGIPGPCRVSHTDLVKLPTSRLLARNSPWFARHPVLNERYSLCSRTISPRSSNTQYQLERSPRSNPMVSFWREKFLLCFAAAVLTFFIAGLPFICASSTSITWEPTASRRRPAFSSHLLRQLTLTCGWPIIRTVDGAAIALV